MGENQCSSRDHWNKGCCIKHRIMNASHISLSQREVCVNAKTVWQNIRMNALLSFFLANSRLNIYIYIYIKFNLWNIYIYIYIYDY